MTVNEGSKQEICEVGTHLTDGARSNIDNTSLTQETLIGHGGILSIHNQTGVIARLAIHILI